MRFLFFPLETCGKQKIPHRCHAEQREASRIVNYPRRRDPSASASGWHYDRVSSTGIISRLSAPTNGRRRVSI